jgi:hypothetical protein
MLRRQFLGRKKQELPDRGLQIDLHGLQLNITTSIKEHKHEQPIALTIDDYPGTLPKRKANGVEMLEEPTPLVLIERV